MDDNQDSKVREISDIEEAYIQSYLGLDGLNIDPISKKRYVFCKEDFDHLFQLYLKLKNFYAQPEDGTIVLSPRWVPDITKRVMHKRPYGNEPAYPHICRRFTFEEFCILYTLERFEDVRNHEREQDSAEPPSAD